jgi:hypothetical protein
MSNAKSAKSLDAEFVSMLLKQRACHREWHGCQKLNKKGAGRELLEFIER